MARLKGSVRNKARQQQDQLLKSRFEASETRALSQSARVYCAGYPHSTMSRTKLRRSTSASDSQVEKRQKKKQLNKSTVRLRDTTGIHGSSPTVTTASSGDPSGTHRSTSFDATASLGESSRIPRCPPTDAIASSRDPSGEPLSPPTGAIASFGDPSGLLRSPSTDAILAPSIQALRTVSAWDYVSEYNLPGVSPDHVQVRDGGRLVSMPVGSRDYVVLSLRRNPRRLIFIYTTACEGVIL
jgi:hypothetical protein